MSGLDNYFNLSKLNTNIPTEIMAGITTFLTMSYIIIVNPTILSNAGMDFNGVLLATILVCSISSILMGLYAKLPYGLAPGMGINAFFTYTLVLGMGLTWQSALGVVFISGIIFIILSVLSIREMIVKAIPISLRFAIAGGIGLFIAFIGFQNAKLIVDNPATLVGLGNFTPAVILFLIGILVMAFLSIHKVKGALLLGIVFTTILGIGIDIFFHTNLVQIPDSIFSTPNFEVVFFKLDIMSALKFSMILPIFTLLFTDMFDSISTFLGVAQAANLLDKEGQPKNVKKALLVDAISTTVSGLVGTSSGTTYIESASGIEEGGRSGLTAVVIGLLFLPFMFLSPLAGMVPTFATAPALVMVGVFMMQSIRNINFKQFDEGIPAFLAMILIPLTYSITQGIIWGFISYTLLKILSGKSKDIHPMMYVITAFSVFALWIK